MVRSFTFALAVLGTAAVLSAQAQTPSQGRPPVDQPAGQQPPYTPAPSPMPPDPASQPPTTSTTTMSSSTTTTTDAGKVTWSGCLKPGATAGTWMLDNATLAPASGSTAGASAAGSSSQAVATSGNASAAAHQSFNLSTKPGTDLTAHANHQIEVVGTLSPASAGATTSSATSSASGSTASASTTPRQTFNVESFKMVSASCR